MSAANSLQDFRQFPDRLQQKIRPRRTQALFRGKWSEYRDRLHSRALRHLQILRRISDVHARRWFQTQFLQREPQWRRIGFLFRSVAVADARSKKLRQFEGPQL